MCLRKQVAGIYPGIRRSECILSLVHDSTLNYHTLNKIEHTAMNQA